MGSLIPQKGNPVPALCPVCMCRFTLYQLYKASVGSQGGSRLKGYLNHDDNVRVCYAGDIRWGRT